ncbi:ubiquitin-conjugating enzyme E2 J1 [Galendromus occidentalis]|uniref:Ubiquitin-conjugating enzyme E2 J1 n=1 Tax=Galendromus occidentalis TaxID=34638 RepID=A0AAJ6QSY8_9ACAR|nr:ubiquitin-conjugating enzyme E2 J1 [Galendromus occidentalis]
MAQYNQRNPAVKRLMKEAQELREPTEDYFAQPLEDNLFEWHFTVRGPPDSDYDGGIYHGRILLPSEYPMKPPNIIIMTPNGRFETNKKICLSISGHHPETWQPSWSLRTAMLALIGFMPTQGEGAIGSLDCPSDERKKMARKSCSFKCSHCGPTKNLLKEQSKSGPSKTNEEARQLASQMSFTSEGAKQGDSHALEQRFVPAEEAQEDAHAGDEPDARPTEPAETEVRCRMPAPSTGSVAHDQQPQVTPSAGVTTPRATPTTITTAQAPSENQLLISVFMFICAAVFLSLFVRRACFLLF